MCESGIDEVLFWMRAIQETDEQEGTSGEQEREDKPNKWQNELVELRNTDLMNGKPLQNGRWSAGEEGKQTGWKAQVKGRG